MEEDSLLCTPTSHEGTEETESDLIDPCGSLPTQLIP